ncbi:unnamed protein product [Rotaria sp. Silwood2]|nr:unnamed protein product [Rotaria sp. Silwood2]CAF2854010.1 unnamed protein product [Rotaria sp. Silwood2]CAF3001411.1 unnamed protein product [Rotaria sp. Silwood2]CAF3987797.1 unnamed protein product [Rotaria sp. Silwood2]CAF4039632.1 unnamed protein product [Rotaria sp. Silwood2]
MQNIDQSTLLYHQWNDFIYRLKQLIYLLSQYEKLHFHSIHSSLSDTKQNLNKNEEQYTRKENIQYELLTIEKIKHVQIDKTIEDIQLNLKTNENIIEKANKRHDVIRQEMNDIQSFIDSINEWKKRTIQNL